MKFLSNTRAKYVAAAFTALAAIVIPAQATDCNTYCQNAAQQAGNAAAQQAQTTAPSYCTNQVGAMGNLSSWDYGQFYGQCMYNTINNAYLIAYNQTLAQCNGSCH